MDIMFAIHHRWLSVLAILCGVITGLGSFFLLFAVPGFPGWKYAGQGARFNGRIVSIDPKEETIAVMISSVFPQSPPQKMRLAYDESTAWSSINFIFKNNLVVERRVRSELPQSLPEGTLVSLQYDPDAAGALRAKGVSFLRRSEL